MGWFRRSKASRSEAAPLLDFLSTRRGVEGYVEPPTQFNPTTLVLVADDGESMRRQVASAQWAHKFCREQEIPCYDVNRVGYPRRMREYKQRSQERARAATSATVPTGPSREELAAIMTLETIAGADPLGDRPAPDALKSLHRQARVRAHPDRHGGDRKRWDQVEGAAKTLGLL